MKKNEIRKEIASLIDNIKEHSDAIGNQKRIPQLELELILSKITKLYERSIVYNYLNSLDELRPGNQEGNIQQLTTEPPLSHPGHIQPEAAIIATEVTETVTPPIKQAETEKKKAGKLIKNPISDLKAAIGINERLLFINQLFKGSTEEYNSSLTRLNSFGNLAEAETFIESLKQKFHWKDDSPAFLSLLSLIERRYL